jgi:hypothetical protein
MAPKDWDCIESLYAASGTPPKRPVAIILLEEEKGEANPRSAAVHVSSKNGS